MTCSIYKKVKKLEIPHVWFEGWSTWKHRSVDGNPVKLGHIAVDIDLGHLAEVACVRFLLCKGTAPCSLTSAFPYSPLWMEVTVPSPQFRECYVAPPGKWNVCINYWEFFCWEICLFLKALLHTLLYVIFTVVG